MSLESKHRKRMRMTKLRGALLGGIEAAGVITLAAMAPNVLALLGPLQKRREERLLSAVTRLKNAGLIQFDGRRIRLTPQGRLFLVEHSLLTKKPRRWDKKWRVVIFDIPERRAARRKVFRNTLMRIGFYRLQDSVWAYPHDCEELMVLLKAEQRLGAEVLYMIVDTIERDAPLRKHFRLT